MNIRFKRNFKLLFDDVLDQFKIIKNSIRKEDDDFMIKNRMEVLYLYRHMLKNVPPMHKNLLEKRCAYEVNIFNLLLQEIKYNFREGSRETDYETICLLKNTCYMIIEKINKGVYPPFPKYRA